MVQHLHITPQLAAEFLDSMWRGGGGEMSLSVSPTPPLWIKSDARYLQFYDLLSSSIVQVQIRGTNQSLGDIEPFQQPQTQHV